MKPLLILIRTTFVGILWSIFFIEGIRVIMLTNWRFDIFSPKHWNMAWELWLSGWVINDPKEWAFVLIIITFIPLWLTGWAALSMLPLGKIFAKIISIPLNIINRIFDTPVKVIKNTASIKAVKKKKSYKEVRPRSLRQPIDETAYIKQPEKTSIPQPSKPIPIPPAPIPMPKSSYSEPKVADKFDHSLFQFDNDDDFDFDIFEDKPVKEEPKTETVVEAPAEVSTGRKSKNDQNRNRDSNKDNNRDKKGNNNSNQQRNNNNNQPNPKASDNKQRVTSSTMEVLKQKGFEVITGATIKDTLIDYIGVSSNEICLCLIDKESGDWLADEERFNDEEPLWFSESSHRISPVRKIDIARQALIKKLEDSKLEYDVKSFVIIQIGNIINAEDMFEVWDTMNISVTRIDRGSPKELRLFSKSIEESEGAINKESFDKIKKTIRNIA